MLRKIQLKNAALAAFYDFDVFYNHVRYGSIADYTLLAIGEMCILLETVELYRYKWCIVLYKGKLGIVEDACLAIAE